MSFDSIPDELKDLKKLEKALIFKITLFKKIAIIYGKSEFSKIKGSICNIAICKHMQLFTEANSFQ